MGWGALLGAVSALGAGFLMYYSTMNSLQREIQYRFNRLWPNLQFSPEQGIELYFRGLISEDELKSILKDHGYSEDKFDKLKELAKTLLTAEQNLELYLRGKIDKEELIRRFKALGYDEKAVNDRIEITKRIFTINEAFALWRIGKISKEELIAILKAHGVKEDDFDKYEWLTAAFPTPSDIVRFAVREVFTPEVARKYGLEEDMPKEYLELAKKVGLSEEFAKWYWMAHWELPSITEGIEMFHRGIISKEELELLLRVHDIMPYWRDKLIQLSYIIPTRVDVRRMYEIGVITYEELIEYYKKMGYSPQDAERLAKWTAIEYVQYDRDLTTKQVIELYLLGEFDRDKAKEYLQKLVFSYIRSISNKLALAEHEQLLKEAKEVMETLKIMYVEGKMDYDTFFAEMIKLPFTPTTIKKEIAKAEREKRKQTKLPTKAELKKWLKLGIITQDDFKKYLGLMGYREEDILRYIEEINKATSLQEVVAGSE
jgi:hypothetical protein